MMTAPHTASSTDASAAPVVQPGACVRSAFAALRLVARADGDGVPVEQYRPLAFGCALFVDERRACFRYVCCLFSLQSQKKVLDVLQNWPEVFVFRRFAFWG